LDQGSTDSKLNQENVQKSWRTARFEKRQLIKQVTTCARYRMRQRPRYSQMEISKSSIHGGDGFQRRMHQSIRIKMEQSTRTLPTTHNSRRFHLTNSLSSNIALFLWHCLRSALSPLYVRHPRRSQKRTNRNFIKFTNRRRLHRNYPRQLRHPKKNQIKRSKPKRWKQSIRKQIFFNKIQSNLLQQSIWQYVWILFVISYR